MASVAGLWTRLVSEERLQRSSQTLSIVGSAAYIFGGELLPRQPVDNQLDRIELAQEASASLHKTLPAPSKAPTPRVGSTTTSIQDSIYLFSGRGGTAMAPIEERGAIWSYNTATSEWDLVTPADPEAPFPEGRSYHATASDGVAKVYIHAGCPEKGRLSDLWSFDVASRAWAKLPDAPAPPRGGTSLAFSDGKLYRMNGFDGNSEQGGAIDVFDLQQGTGSTVSFQPDGKQGPEPRSVSALLAFKVQGRQFILTLFGERDPSALGHAGAGKMLADVWLFDIGSSTWTEVKTTSEAPPARGWFDADVASVTDDMATVVVHGGLAEDNSRLGDVWSLQLKWQ